MPCHRTGYKHNIIYEVSYVRALGDPNRGLGGMSALVEVPCDHGERAHGHCMLEHAERICEVALGVTSVSLRRFAYNARSRCHSLW